MLNYPLVSIITVNYNQSQATCEMLKSLYAGGYPNLEVIVVDNASPSDDPQIIKEKFPEIRLIKNKCNMGFAGGNNVALRLAKGEYVYLVNNDTILPQNHIEQLLKTTNSDKSIGVVCSKIKFHHTPNMIQFAGYSKMSRYTFRNRCFGYKQIDNGQYDYQAESAYAHGAAMFLKRDVIKRVGLMNEHYFLYYEELDWSERIRKMGYKIIYTPSTYILHKESLSTGKNSPLKDYYLNRNRVLFIRCNASGVQKAIGVMYQMCLAIPKNILRSAVHGRFENSAAITKAWGWNMKKLSQSETLRFERL